VIERFHALTGVPLVLNTSFNDHGEPIVETPLDAYQCFATTAMDALAIGP
jgi:carbamoyltransferase